MLELGLANGAMKTASSTSLITLKPLAATKSILFPTLSYDLIQVAHRADELILLRQVAIGVVRLGLRDRRIMPHLATAKIALPHDSIKLNSCSTPVTQAEI